MKTIAFLRTLALFLTVTITALPGQVPQILNYQGRVAVGEPAVNFDGSGTFKFALVDNAGTTSYWSNDGTSTAGSEPTDAVTLTVIKGLYSVLLGDSALANMTAIPSSAFANADVRLRVWFNDGANGSQLLTPDQRLAAVGYAMVADTVSDGAITSAKLAAGAVGNGQLAAGALPASLAITGNYQVAEANTSYRATSASATSFTLPSTAEIGDLVQITSSDAGGWNALNPDLPWMLRLSGTFDWVDLAASADGSKLIAAKSDGQLQLSTDYGVTWTARESIRNWEGVASSADGSVLYAYTAGIGPIYLSTDSGINWSPLPTHRDWGAVECSADGSHVIALRQNGPISVSDNHGTDWQNYGPSSGNWQSAAISADGSTLIAVATLKQIHISTDSGATWELRETNRYWNAVTSSADGRKLVAGVYNDQLFTSTDSGETWTPRANVRLWSGLASSADGSVLLGLDYYGKAYISLDSGVVWTPTPQNYKYWSRATVSDDGENFAALARDGVYTLNSPNFGGSPGTTGLLQYLGEGFWGSVDQTQIAADAIGSEQIADGTIGSAKIASGAIGNAQLATGTVLTPEAIAGPTQAVAVNTNYQATSAASTSIILPTTAEVGDVVTITGAGAGGWSAGNPSGAWTPHESNRNWSSMASSADGAKLIAAEHNGQIYTSTDSGLTWTVQTDAGTRQWEAVASSADGAKLVAATVLFQIHTSTDSGVTWTARGSNSTWSSVTSSADGVKLAATNRGQIFTSSDSGVTWMAQPGSGNRAWESVASSADGTKLVAAVTNGQLYTSTDSGVTWTARESDRNWKAVASSADGIKLVAVVYSGQIYTSTDSGVTWIPRESDRRWQTVASSADGVTLVAGGLDPLYVSRDSGLSWTSQETGSANRYWSAVASSADGNKLVASVGTSPREGQIYTSSSFSGAQGSTTTLQYLGSGLWGAVAQNLIATGAVGREQLAKWAIGSDEIEPGAVGSTQLAANLALTGDVSTTGELTCTALNITSDRNAKKGFAPIDSRSVLDKVVNLPITQWQYRDYEGIHHIGPMAQDFHKAFGVGRDERHITTVDADGIALAAIQGLNEKMEERDRDKDQRILELEKTVTDLQRLVNQLAKEKTETSL